MVLAPLRRRVAALESMKVLFNTLGLLMYHTDGASSAFAGGGRSILSSGAGGSCADVGPPGGFGGGG